MNVMYSRYLTKYNLYLSSSLSSCIHENSAYKRHIVCCAVTRTSCILVFDLSLMNMIETLWNCFACNWSVNVIERY